MSDRFEQIENKLDSLLSGQVADEIHQIAEGQAATQAAIGRFSETVCRHFDERFTPLENAIREHLRAS